MINGKKIVVVMPAYNAAKTVEATYREIPLDVIDRVVLVDDASSDETVALSRRLGIETLVHPKNLGYGGNQKTCYQHALNLGADVIVMLHPDYQYTPRLLVSIAAMVAYGEYDMAIGSRLLLGGARRGGMPFYKYISNRVLTISQNLLMGTAFSEFHTGYRAYSREVLIRLPLHENSDNFVFDNQVMAQAIAFGFRIGEISVPTKYFREASSISLWPSTVYGIGVMATGVQYFLCRRLKVCSFPIFSDNGRRLSA